MPSEVPIHIQENRKLRLKLTDWCNLACPFCHSEGAVGANDMSPTDRDLLDALRRLRLHFDRVHLTGGEPSSYGSLEEMMDVLQRLGYAVSITSNGLFNCERSWKWLKRCDYVNISFHSLSPDYFRQFLMNDKSVGTVIEVIRRNVEWLSKRVSTRLNTVISGDQDEQQLTMLHEFADSLDLRLKLVPDWRTKEVSRRFILAYLDSLGFQLESVLKIVPGSNVRLIFGHPERGRVEVKDIDPFRPEFLCQGCRIVDQCVEAFSFVRIERTPAQFRLCIYKPQLDSASFFRLFETHMAPLISGRSEKCSSISTVFAKARFAAGEQMKSFKAWDLSVEEVAGI